MVVCTSDLNCPMRLSEKPSPSAMAPAEGEKPPKVKQLKVRKVKRMKVAKKSRRIPRSNLEKINMHAAGIDVASGEHWVCVPPEAAKKNVRKFGAFTEDLHAISRWLKECGVTTVAMESTGLYWVPLYLRLTADGFEVYLVNARHVKSVSGRPKTDRLDCQWIQRLHTYGLLSPSFVPDEDHWMFRAIVRHRANLIELCDREIQYMQKALQQMNLLLAKVISDITGVTGMKIIDAILGGERDPMTLAKLADPRIKSSAGEIAKALDGEYRDELLFVLKQAVEAYRFHRRQMIACDQKIDGLLDQWHRAVDDRLMAEAKAAKKVRKPKQNEPTYDAWTHFVKIYGVDLTQLPGVSLSTIQTLFAEFGADFSPWPTDSHFTSWFGLSPSPDVSGGKILKNKTEKVQSRGAEALRMAALACGKTDTALGAFYRRLKARKGAKKALTATARKLAIIIYAMVTEQREFIDLGADYYLRYQAGRVRRQLERKARLLGFKLVPIDDEDASSEAAVLGQAQRAG